MKDYQLIGWMLNNSTAVNDVVEGRIYHGLIPETERNPTINYFMVDDPLIADGVARRPRFQISCRADTPNVAVDLAREVHGVFSNKQGTFNGFDLQKSVFDSSRLISESVDEYNAPVDVFILYVN